MIAINIRTVARKAGVSVATVSRVLNHPDSVAAATREHVLQMMKELNYTPNWFARGLNLNVTGVVALMVPNILNPAYTQIAKGVEEVARQRNNNILLCNTEDDIYKERDYIEMFISRKIDGLILVSSRLSSEELAEIKKRDIPLVLIGKTAGLAEEHTVFTDFAAGSYEAASHLLELGYDPLAVVSGSFSLPENQEKLSGMKRALTEAGKNLPDGMVIEVDNTIEGGMAAAGRLQAMSPRPRGIFAFSDVLAFGIMEYFAGEGIAIPNEIALVGFDNVRMASVVEPKLTTVNQPVYKMGLVAARLLFDLIDSKTEGPPQQICLESKLKIRRSCGHEDRLREIFD